MRRGFTLIELILVIALIALVGGLVAINAEAMLRGLSEEPVDRIFQKAVREARFQAASIKEPTFLRYDGESGVLEISTETGRSLASFRTTPADSEQFPRLEFEQLLPGFGLSGLSRQEAVEIDTVVFRPDRSSTPFRVRFDLAQSSFTQRYDPFSAIVIDDSRQP